MKVVVTGGSGQLGTRVLERMIANRKIKRILSLDLVPPMVCASKLRWHLADVRDPGLDRHFEGADAVVHLAFIAVKYAPPEQMHAVNVEGSKNVFEAVAKAGVKKILYASSIAAYGIVADHPVPLFESAPRKPCPEIPYSQNKFDVEQYLDDFEEQHPDTSVVRFRPTLLFGSRMDHALGAVLRRGIAPDFGSVPVPIVWDEDVADAFVLGLLEDVQGAFNLSAADAITAGDLARAGDFRVLSFPSGIEKAAPVLQRLGVDTAWLKMRGKPMLPSCARAYEELGWKPRCPKAVDVLDRYVREAPRKLDPRIALFMRMVRALARRQPDSDIPEEARRINLRIHLRITGARGGDYDLEVKEGRMHVRRGVPRPPDATILLSDGTFLDAFSGKTDTATLELTGKIRVRGEPNAGLVMHGMVEAFRKSTKRSGAPGWTARKLSDWFGKGIEA